MAYDKAFLYLLDRIKRVESYVRVELLDFQERPMKEIQGVATEGSITVDGTSAVRRTLSLTLGISSADADVENISNDFSIDKKIKVYKGISNPFYKYNGTNETFIKYKGYGETVWFPLGLYVITSAQVASAVNTCTLTLSGKDKMVMLNGFAGGTLPASVTFSEEYVEDADGNITVSYPTIGTIIREAVTHYGGENMSNVIINDIEETAKELVKYNNSETPIWILDDYSTFVIAAEEPAQVTGHHWIKKVNGQDLGYKETDFTYPGELTLSAGETVTSLLDKIVTTLGGNYEYFYDLDGHFVFQEKRNYQYNSYTYSLTALDKSAYISNFSDSKYIYAFTDMDTTVSLNKNPKYENVKNDYICWGARKVGDTELGIRYHLAIDHKPRLDRVYKYMWKTTNTNSDGIEYVLQYYYTDTDSAPVEGAVLVSNPCTEANADWREELYRIALENAVTNNEEGYYDQELLAEWRKLFNPDLRWVSDTYEEEQDDGTMKTIEVYTDWSTYNGWNPDVYEDPGSLDFWLDFIDDGAELGAYSVNKIGRRTKVINESTVRYLYGLELKDIMFIPNDDTLTSEYLAKLQAKGQEYCVYQPYQEEYLVISSTGSSAFDTIRTALYQSLTYATTISMTAIPIYYLEPNHVVFINDKFSNTRGEYVINRITLPLAYNGTMNLELQSVLNVDKYIGSTSYTVETWNDLLSEFETWQSVQDYFETWEDINGSN